MRRNQASILSLLVIVLAAMLVSTTMAQETTEEPTPTPEPGVTYTVQRGDNLFRIALRFGTTPQEIAAANGITNTALIYTGQVLLIPGAQPVTPTVETTETPEPVQPATEQTTYTVQAGDNLYRIALRFGTTVADLVATNDIANPSIIFVGQQLTIPGAAETSVVTPSDTVAGVDMSIESPGFDYGVVVFIGNQDADVLSQQITQLGVHWVKIRVEWRELEPTQGQIDYAHLDEVVDSLKADGRKIMLTVTSAPTWARTSRDETGPPDDLTDFTTFVGVLAEHYAGRVDAYQIWDEPNLRRNWNCGNRMCQVDYLELLQQAYGVIKAADASAMVVTAGFSPTRYNDRVNAIDDRLYLETLYANRVADFSDAIGAHPGGWANPPDAECCEQPAGVLTHYEDNSFYFLENLHSYREIMVRYGDAETPIWVTKFGWGTSEDTDPPSDMYIFVSYTSLAEQAIYVPRAFELGRELGYIGPMFLDNLNGCQSTLGRAELCYSSLISPNRTLRPAFGAVQNMDKPDTESPDG